jgi:hypothetical protein
MVRVPLEQIAGSSDTILRGEVVGQQSRWTADHEKIVTDFTIRVSDVWAGDLASAASVLVEVPGGEVASIGMRMEDQPFLATGEDVVLFLVKRPDGTLSVNQDIQGKFSVQGDRVVGHDDLSFALAAFRNAAQGAFGSGGLGSEALFPPGDSVPPLADDDYYAWSGQMWSGGRLPYTWWLNQSGAPGCTVNDTQAALASGFNTWICASGVSMVYGGTTALNATNHSDLINVLAWEFGTLGSGTIALCTWVYYTETGEIIEIDIQFNATHYSWSCYGSATAMDVGNIGTHEIGHTLALLDLYGANDTNKTMYGYGTNGELVKRTLLQADALGDEFIYPHARANFVAATPGGWSGPLVPRNTADANGAYAPLPPQLNGNDYCYVNAAMTDNGGDCAAPSGINNLYLDHVNSYWTSWGGVWGTGYTGGWVNLAHFVAGGRHTLSQTIDDYQETLESDESDNTYHAQYVWSPLTTYWGSPWIRSCPPNTGVFGLPNCDGTKFTRSADYSWVVSLAPWIPGDDYDLYVYDDYSGSLAGFSNLRGVSTYGSNYTDFVVGHYQGSPLTVYPAAIRYAAPSGYYYSIDQIDTTGRYALETGLWLDQYLGDYRLTDIYEGFLVAGNTYRIRLLRDAGSADIGFNVYPAASGVIYGRGSASGYSIPVGPDQDVLDFTAATSGWHPIVVYRNDGTDPTPVVYSFSWGPPSADAGDPEASAPRLAFHGAVPNPMHGTTKLAFQLPASERVQLDLYDVGGRRVRSLLEGTFGPGLVEPVWDGRSDDGQHVAAGLYWARLQAQGRSIVRLVTVLK